ncbi:MAG TPA: cyclic nucleotide-binding domain-containing protein [Terriglobales bacterium]|nr:cyclic nucleotide-binding domain-containing protein [Terriglobales bacterium]
MLTVAEAVAGCRVFDGLPLRYLELIAGCAHFTRFDAGVAIFLEGGDADRFFVLREGRVTLEVFSPERGRIVVQTLGPGDALGWSWLFPPYRWHLDAMAREPVAAIAFDGACLRGKCDVDHELGYELLGRFGDLMLQRLQATRLQLLDVYAHGSR